jgi:HSP20 family protein
MAAQEQQSQHGQPHDQSSTPSTQRDPGQSAQRDPAQTTATQQAGEPNIERRPETSAARWTSRGSSPYSLMRRFGEDMDRLFEDFFGPSLFAWRDWPTRLGWPSSGGQATYWPQIEVHHEGNKLIVQADMPGLKKDDVTVEVRDDELCVSGERRSETEKTEGRYYRSERSYGSFCRTIPLPQGAKPDTASATFENGVLRIEMEAPGGAEGQTRRIEVREGSTH